MATKNTIFLFCCFFNGLLQSRAVPVTSALNSTLSTTSRWANLINAPVTLSLSNEFSSTLEQTVIISTSRATDDNYASSSPTQLLSSRSYSSIQSSQTNELASTFGHNISVPTTGNTIVEYTSSNPIEIYSSRSSSLVRSSQSVRHSLTLTDHTRSSTQSIQGNIDQETISVILRSSATNQHINPTRTPASGHERRTRSLNFTISNNSTSIENSTAKNATLSTNSTSIWNNSGLFGEGGSLLNTRLFHNLKLDISISNDGTDNFFLYADLLEYQVIHGDQFNSTRRAFLDTIDQAKIISSYTHTTPYWISYQTSLILAPNEKLPFTPLSLIDGRRKRASRYTLLDKPIPVGLFNLSDPFLNLAATRFVTNLLLENDTFPMEAYEVNKTMIHKVNYLVHGEKIIAFIVKHGAIFSLVAHNIRRYL